MDKALYPILIVQTILYLVAFISGLAASISIAVMNVSIDTRVIVEQASDEVMSERSHTVPFRYKRAPIHGRIMPHNG